jgi:hypothetical protein
MRGQSSENDTNQTLKNLTVSWKAVLRSGMPHFAGSLDLRNARLPMSGVMSPDQAHFERSATAPSISLTSTNAS